MCMFGCWRVCRCEGLLFAGVDSAMCSGVRAVVCVGVGAVMCAGVGANLATSALNFPLMPFFHVYFCPCSYADSNYVI